MWNGMNGARRAAYKRKTEEDRVKKEFVETGEFDRIQKILKKKRKSEVSISELPF